ncbi:hypothetical protein, partial [Rhodovulum sulfidophilum]|uniref:hypothetical protein n=1 Tax=Rhodovulum sulfidophilum TaxID=35806 RepID=UPI001F2AE1EF
MHKRDPLDLAGEGKDRILRAPGIRLEGQRPVVVPGISGREQAGQVIAALVQMRAFRKRRCAGIVSGDPASAVGTIGRPPDGRRGIGQRRGTDDRRRRRRIRMGRWWRLQDRAAR